MLDSLNGSVPALQADSHGIQIHGAPAPPCIFNRCRPGRVARATKTNVFIGQAFVTWTFDRKYQDDRAHLYQKCMAKKLTLALNVLPSSTRSMVSIPWFF